MSCDHATILHSVKTVSDKLDIRDARYIEALNRWKLVFENLGEEVRKATDTSEVVRSRVLDIISRAVSEGGLDPGEIKGLLESVLRITTAEAIL